MTNHISAALIKGAIAMLGRIDSDHFDFPAPEDWEAAPVLDEAIRLLQDARSRMVERVDVIYLGFDDDKILAIKSVRAALDLGLKEAKDLVECDAGKAVVQNVPPTEALKIIATLKEGSVRAEIREQAK